MTITTITTRADEISHRQQGDLGYPQAVFDDGRLIGHVVRRGGLLLDQWIPEMWAVRSAGEGVPFDTAARYATAIEAIEAIQKARAAAGVPVPGDHLSDFELAVLTAVTVHGLDRAALASLARTMNVSMIRFWQVFNRLLDDPRAAADFPFAVDAGRQARTLRGTR